MESAVDTAVREKLARLRTPEEEERRRARIYEGVRALQEAFKKYPEAMVDHAELLYGEDGMPK